MVDRFDLEQEILRTSDYASQLKNLAEFMVDNDGNYSTDRVHNIIIGLAEMLDIHTDKMYNVMCDCLCLNQKEGKCPRQ